ncbi:MAG: NADH-quinone oxidoreductase subunit E [Candidatus Sericytochromatia bacterium]|nr:MAG: NADH-quinone oxidoreductase subunit E [Candidatus Sericytochromatia bacterium]
MVEFSPERFEEFKKIVAKYPQKDAALLPTLWMAQEDFGYLSLDVMKYVAKILDIPPSKVYSVASFYTMFKKKPTGKYLIQICRTLSCKLRGAEEVTEYICNKLGIGLNETTKDNKFTVIEVECLGSCGTAPMMQINNDYYENLTKRKIDSILDNLE